MISINQFIMSGTIRTLPKISVSKNGCEYVRFRVSVHQPIYKGGFQPSLSIPVYLFGSMAGFIYEYTSIGTIIVAHGHLFNHIHKDSLGEERSQISMYAERCDIVMQDGRAFRYYDRLKRKIDNKAVGKYIEENKEKKTRFDSEPGYLQPFMRGRIGLTQIMNSKDQTMKEVYKIKSEKYFFTNSDKTSQQKK